MVGEQRFTMEINLIELIKKQKEKYRFVKWDPFLSEKQQSSLKTQLSDKIDIAPDGFCNKNAIYQSSTLK